MANQNNRFTEFWAGGLETLQVAQDAEQRMRVGMEGNEPQGSNRLSVIGGVGIIQIAGALVNRDSPWNAIMGVISYGEIRAALAEALNNPNIKEILLDVNSGGGAVSGITDTAKLIQQINTIKPVTAYCGGNMASGGYWLGVSAGKVICSDIAVLGSIGVITTHMDLSGSYAQEGIVPTVIRAGKYKQLNSPMEPLSATGRTEIQSQLDQVYSVFVQHIADNRQVSYGVADNQMAQGREFIGAQALTAGLVDAIATFDELLATMVAKVALDTNKSFGNNSLKPLFKAKNMTLSLTQQQLAILASGGVLAEDELTAATLTAEQEALATANAALEAEATAAEAAALAAEVSAAAALAGTETAVATQGSDITAYLQNELKLANASLADANFELRTLKASSEAALASQDALLAIACKSLNVMNVALGGSERDLTGMTAVQALADHAAASLDFNKKFKIGGVASATPELKAEATNATVTPLHLAKIHATKGNK